MIDMTVTIEKECIGESSDGTEKVTLTPGTKVQYKGHVPGGMLLVEHEGRNLVVNPLATDLK